MLMVVEARLLIFQDVCRNQGLMPNNFFYGFQSMNCNGRNGRHHVYCQLKLVDARNLVREGNKKEQS